MPKTGPPGKGKGKEKGKGKRRDGQEQRKRRRVTPLEARLREQGLALNSAEGGYVDPEDEEIERLERKLGWAGKSSTDSSIAKELAEEGFGEDFGNFLSILDTLGDREKESKGEVVLQFSNPVYNFQTVADSGVALASGASQGKKLSLSERAAAASQGGRQQKTAKSKEKRSTPAEGSGHLPLGTIEEDSEEEGADGKEGVDAMEGEEGKAPAADHSDSNAGSDSESEEGGAAEVEAEASEESDSSEGEKEEEHEKRGGKEEDAKGTGNVKGGTSDNAMKEGKEAKDGPKKYVPPALRNAGNDRYAALKRKIKGLLNRLSESNIESVALELDALFSENPTAVVTDAVWDVIGTSCSNDVLVLRHLIMCYAGCLFILHNFVGPELTSHVVEKCVQRLQAIEHIPKDVNGGDMPGTTPAGNTKESNNLLLLLCFLYFFGAMDGSLVLDVLRFLSRRLLESDAELILLSLQHLGFVFRKSDPTGLRDVIANAQRRAKDLYGEDLLMDRKTKKKLEREEAEEQEVKEHEAVRRNKQQRQQRSSESAFSIADRLKAKLTGTRAASSAPQADVDVDEGEEGEASSLSRMKVMLELLRDLRNNRMRESHEELLVSAKSVKKFIRTAVARRRKEEGLRSALTLSWLDVVRIPEMGRWWLVGAAWVGNRTGDLAQAQSSVEDAKKKAKDRILQADDPETRALLRLAQKQRMNSDVKRRVFVALMGADDAADGVERLLQLGLKGPAEREIVRVLLDCAGQERKYNAYYAAVGVALCEKHQRFRFTFQLAYWDFFKTMAEASDRKLFNLAKLLAALILKFSLSLSLLKRLDFTALEDQGVMFLLVVITQIFNHASETTVRSIFTRIGGGTDRELVKNGVSYFLHQYMKDHLKTVAKGKKLLELLAKLKIARKSLEMIPDDTMA